MKLTVNVVETSTTFITRESIEIDTDNYPELVDKTEDEVKEYIRENMWDMESTNPDYPSLGEELIERDIVMDDMSDLETEVEFGN
jgi:hypothetical protein